jgi:hypothetical protein
LGVEQLSNHHSSLSDTNLNRTSKVLKLTHQSMQGFSHRQHPAEQPLVGGFHTSHTLHKMESDEVLMLFAEVLLLFLHPQTLSQRSVMTWYKAMHTSNSSSSCDHL